MKLVPALALMLGGTAVDAHGRMERLRAGGTTVFTRKGPGFEDSPTGPTNKFICRNPPKAPAITVTAGGTMDLEWSFGAAHLGDCALYMSYGGDKFFKIANFPECNIDNNKFMTVNLPKWLPNGVAVVRWDWYALHVFPGAELYAQCTDVTVAGSDGTVSVAALDAKAYSVVNPLIYPTRSGNGGLVYRNPRGNNRPKFFMTGPDCIGGVTGNCCDVADYTYGAGYANCQNKGTSAGEPPAGAVSGGGGSVPEPGAPPTPAPTPSSNPCVLYNVVSGDSLSSIAADFSAKQCPVTAAAIASFNMVSDMNVIDVGETYTIPCPNNCCTDSSCVAGQQGGINNKAKAPVDPVAQATQDAKDKAGSLGIAVGLLSTVVVGLLAVIVKGRRGAGTWMSSGAAGPPAAASAAGGAPPLPPRPNAKPTRLSKHPEVGGESAIKLNVNDANTI